MRYPASEKLEIIRIVEQSHLPAKRTLDQLGVARRTFYRWYDRYLEGGPEALQDRPSAPSRVWNRIGKDIQQQIVGLALEQTDLSPRELAVRFTDEKRYFVSEATVYRLLKAHDLITSPAYVVIKAADQFHTKTTRPNEMWQTDFTYFKIIGWGWMYLSTVLDEGLDLLFEIAGQEVVFQQHAVLQGLVPAFDLALRLRMEGSAAHMAHPVCLDVFG